MFKESWKKSAGILVLIGPLLVAACANQDDVKRAQSTADQALAAAQKASADAAACSARADRMYQENLKK
jgi:hypothetical protein